MTRNKIPKRVNIVLGVIALVCIGLFVYKNNKDMSMKKYEWEPTSNAPILFPADIHVAYMRYGENSALAMTSSDNNGLGSFGSSYGLEGAFPLPTGLDVIWLSEVEKKFYKAEVDFPMERISRLFEEGFINFEGEKKTFHWVNACFIPGGRIVVYLTGFEKSVILAEYQGEETTVDMKDFMPDGYFAYKDYNEYFNVVFSRKDCAWLENYKSNGIPYGLWDRYFERFNYDIKFIFENTDSVHDSNKYNFINGEVCIMSKLYVPTMNIVPASRIRTIMTHWIVGEYLYTAWLYFNEQEILDVFDEAFKNDKEQHGELRVWVSKYNNLFEITLNVGGNSFKLGKTQIRVFKELANVEKAEAELIYKNYEGNHDKFLGE